MSSSRQPVSRLEVRFGLVVVAIFAICAGSAVWLRVKHSWGLALEDNPSPVAALKQHEVETFERVDSADIVSTQDPVVATKIEHQPLSELHQPAGQLLQGDAIQSNGFGIETTSAETIAPVITQPQPVAVQPAPDRYLPTELEKPLATAFAAIRIEQGDTIWTVTKKHYPSLQYAQALWRHNHERFPKPNDLTVGLWLETPSPEYLKVTFPDTFKPVQAAIETPAPKIRQYEIRSGDTLFSIAKKELGATHRWVELYRLNHKSVGDDPAVLPVGVVINLPTSNAGDQ